MLKDRPVKKYRVIKEENEKVTKRGLCWFREEVCAHCRNATVYSGDCEKVEVCVQAELLRLEMEKTGDVK